MNGVGVARYRSITGGVSPGHEYRTPRYGSTGCIIERSQAAGGYDPAIRDPSEGINVNGNPYRKGYIG